MSRPKSQSSSRAILFHDQVPVPAPTNMTADSVVVFVCVTGSSGRVHSCRLEMHEVLMLELDTKALERKAFLSAKNERTRVDLNLIAWQVSAMTDPQP
jgi:hypothetical protein